MTWLIITLGTIFAVLILTTHIITEEIYIPEEFQFVIFIADVLEFLSFILFVMVVIFTMAGVI